MATPIQFNGANVTLKGNGTTVGDLNVFRNNESVTSCWMLSSEEMAEIIRTGRIYVSTHGYTTVPVYVAGEKEMTASQADAKPMPKQDISHYKVEGFTLAQIDTLAIDLFFTVSFEGRGVIMLLEEWHNMSHKDREPWRQKAINQLKNDRKWPRYVFT